MRKPGKVILVTFTVGLLFYQYEDKIEQSKTPLWLNECEDTFPMR
jgi:hypothetical protein